MRGTFDQRKLDEFSEKRDRLQAQLDELKPRYEETRDEGVPEKMNGLKTAITRVGKDIVVAKNPWNVEATEGERNPQTGEFEIAGDAGATRRETGPGAEFRDAALRANERAEFLPGECREHMENQLREDQDPEARLARLTSALADRDYFRAFAAWLRDPVSGGHEWSDSEREAVQNVRVLERALGLGSQGRAFMTPYELDPAVLIAGTGAISPLRQICRVDTTSFNVKKYVTSLGVTTTWRPEAEQQSDDSPTLLQPEAVCKKGQGFVPVSFELFEDTSIAQEVQKLFLDAKNVQEALSFTITQTNGPTGLITALVAAGGSTVIATGTNVLAQADLYNNQAALPARWRANANWSMNPSILNGFRQLPQATGLNYSIVNDDGPLPKILGWDVYENSSMDESLTGAAADYALLSGDFKQFAIVDRIGAAIEYVPVLFGAAQRPTGQRGFLLHWRTGLTLLIPDAFRLSNYST